MPRSPKKGKSGNKTAKSKPHITTKSTKPIEKVVKDVLSKELEIKYAQANIFNQLSTLGYGLNNNGANSLGLSSTSSIIPSILTGTDSATRTGNKVNPKGFYVKYTLRAQQVTSGGVNENPFIPFMVRVILFSRKNNRLSNDNTGILQSGSTSSNFGSAPETWLEPYNHDAFHIYYTKQYTMVAPRRQTGQTAPNQYAQDAVVDGARSFYFKKIKVKGMPSSFIYDDSNNSNKPTNAAVYMAVCVCNVDGSTGLSQTTDQRLMVNADAQLYYTDA